MENSGLLILLTISLVSLVHCSSLSSSLTLLEQHRIAKTLQQPPKDLASLYYAVTGLQAIGKSVHDKEAMCTFAVTNLKKDNAQSLMQFSFVAKILGCSGLPALSIADLINDGIEPVNFANLIIAMGNLGQKVDDAIVKKFVAVAKDNDAPSGAAASFLAASVLPASPDLKPIVSMVEDVVAQADEVNSEYLQFEGGLAVTSKVITGILALGDQQGQRLMKEDQAVKFAKYLVNRKYVHTLKDIHHLLVALGALSTNKQLVPVVVSVFRSSLITKENPALKVRVTNLIDQSIPEIKISATSVETSGADTTTILENKELTKSDDPDDFIVIDSEIAKGFVAAHSFKLDIMDANPTRGMYKCQLEVGLKPGNKLFALDGAFSVNAKVLAKIMVEDVEIGVGDRDQASVGKTSKLTFPEKLSAALEADYHQKIVMTFKIIQYTTYQLSH
jgi:oligosaccharyltransferase complex subunit delta (ribophorin II)